MASRTLRLFGAANAQNDAVRRPSTAWVRPAIRSRLGRTLGAAARAALDEQAATAAYSAGHSLSIDEAIAEALAWQPRGSGASRVRPSSSRVSMTPFVAG